MRYSLSYRVCLLLAMTLGTTACATQATDELCLDTGTTLELSKELMTPQDTARAIAAAGMIMAELGYTQSRDIAGRYDAINSTPAVKYMMVQDDHFFLLRGHTEAPVGPTQIHFYIYGPCGSGMESERKKYLTSIKDEIVAALQPYATEKISSRDAEFIEVD